MSARLKLDAVYPNAEYRTIVNAAKKHFYGTFATKCLAVLYAVFKPIVVALQTNSVSEVRREIELSRNRVETFYDLAFILASSEDEPSNSASVSRSSPSVNAGAIPLISNPYVPPREETEETANTEVVDSGGSSTSIYAGFEEDD